MNKTRQWAVLTAVACLAVLVAGWFLVAKPQRTHAAQLRTQAASLETDNGHLRAHIAQLKQQQKDIPAEQKQLAAIATKIPDNPALPSLIRQLSAAADGAGVNLVSLAPGQPTTAGATGSTGVAPTAGAAATGTTAAAPLQSISVSINVKGSYFNIEQFFSAVESLSRAMLVNGFTMAPLNAGGVATTVPTSGGTSGPPADPAGTINGQITATVFESASTVAATVPTTTAPAATTPGTTTPGTTTPATTTSSSTTTAH